MHSLQLFVQRSEGSHSRARAIRAQVSGRASCRWQISPDMVGREIPVLAARSADDRPTLTIRPRRRAFLNLEFDLIEQPQPACCRVVVLCGHKKGRHLDGNSIQAPSFSYFSAPLTAKRLQAALRLAKWSASPRGLCHRLSTIIAASRKNKQHISTFFLGYP